MQSDSVANNGPKSEYLEVDPATLLIGSNVRLDRQIDKAFTDSIKEHGVLQPIIGYRDAEGRIVVRYGSRRTVAAVEVGLASVPVVVGRNPDDVERIATQVAENEARRELRAGETVAAMRQLAAFGLSATAIARKTGTKRTRVTAALAVSKSKLATAATDRYELTLEQAAVVAEHDDDTDAVKALVAAARTGQFDHVAQRLRDEQAEAEALATARAELGTAGVTVIERPEYGWRGARLDNLGIDVTEHHGCPGHAAFLSWTYGSERVPGAVYVCTDPAGHGHSYPNGRPAGSEAPGKRPMTEQEKAERKRVIRLNRAWTSASIVRRDFLAGFAARKTPPAGAELFVLTALLSGDHEIKQAMEAHWPLLRETVGVDTEDDVDVPAWMSGPGEIAALIEALSMVPAKRVLVVLTAAILLAWETKTGPHTWRHQSTQSVRYLTQLAVWGYQLSDVERIACGENVDEDQNGPREPGQPEPGPDPEDDLEHDTIEEPTDAH